ncbi:MAG: glycosyltransferase [Rhodobacteraceae bacterium]|nr:glycosyltransferase [Paracoccaceae bacterium]
MDSTPDISVIVVSRDRPQELVKMLSCLRFQDISGFEVIVVTNTPGALEDTAAPRPLRLFDCDEANISVARNVGLAAAKGRYIAFCDDDALPDPSWLRHLLAPFKDPKIGGTGGYTRGRNGISLQWGAVETDTVGVAQPLDIPKDSAPVIFLPSAERAPVMIGTNCAFRASALQQIGGFDPAFAYYLDDSDVSLRLSQAGWHLAIVPRAQVHHGFAAGPYRAQNRVPKTLQPHGRSKAVFCRKYAKKQALEPALAAFRQLQFKRLEKQMLAGLMEPDTLPQLIKSLEKGFSEGRKMAVLAPKPKGQPDTESPPVFSTKTTPHILLVGRKSDKAWMDRLGHTLSEAQIMVTGLTLSRSAAFMQVSFSRRGFWRHRGGQFGKTLRSDPVFRWFSRKQKAGAEQEWLKTIRPVDFVVYPERHKGADIILPQTGVMSCLEGFVVEAV